MRFELFDLRSFLFFAIFILYLLSTTSKAQNSAPTLPSDAQTICTEYEQIDGMAVIEGDILLGPCRQTAEGSWEFTPRGRFAELATGLPDPKAAVVNSSGYWPDGIVPYVISSSLSQANDPVTYSQILSAVRHWHGQSVVQLVSRTIESHYVEFVPSSGCSSFLGRIGGRQEIRLASSGGCGFGSTVHEIGHALGFYHEQSRQDRDGFVTIASSEIEPGREHNFAKYSFGLDLDIYNFGSIMHYHEFAFAVGSNPTIIPNQTQYDAWTAIYGDVPIGQRLELAVLDRKAADDMYNVCWDSTMAASNYWKANAWRSCSASCASPGRSREVFCHNASGTCASDGLCNAATRPKTTESCLDFLDCDFDSDNCAWDPIDSGDDFNWTPSFGPTPSSGTGPSADHTGSGFFLYTEMSSPRQSGDTAFLASPPVEIPSGATISFWYHYFGSNLGTLKVEVTPCGGPAQTVLTISPATTASLDGWRQATVPLPMANNAQIRFKATRASSFSSDIAIDDISVTKIGSLLVDDFESGTLSAWSSTLP